MKCTSLQNICTNHTIIDLNKKETKSLKVRIMSSILLIAVNDIETKYVLSKLKPFESNKIYRSYDNNFTYTIGKFGICNAIHIRSGMGTFEKDSISTVTECAIKFWKPRFILMIGVAWGSNENKQKIGDILISKAVLPYEHAKITESMYIPRTAPKESGAVLYERFKNSYNWEHHIDNRKVKIFRGMILSGDKLLDDKILRDRLCKAIPEAIGGDMESAGLSYTATKYNVNEWIMVKGISDWGYDKQHKRKEKYQRIAIESATSLCLHICNNRAALEKFLNNKNNRIKSMNNITNELVHRRRNSENRCKNAKIVIFDFDGTLSSPGFVKTTWERLWCKLGYTIKDCEEYHKLYSDNKITHNEWCEMTARKFIQRGMSRKILKNVAKDIRLLRGTKETIKFLNNKDIALYIVSGSIGELIKEVLGDLYFYFKEVSANRFCFEGERLIRIEGTKFDFEGKADFVIKKANENCVPLDEVLFIGNSFNDIHVRKTGARTLCINPKNTNYTDKKYWCDSLKGAKSLRDIIPFIFPNHNS